MHLPHKKDSQSSVSARLDAEMRESDTAAKQRMKQYGDSHSHARECQLAIGDTVLMSEQSGDERFQTVCTEPS